MPQIRHRKDYSDIADAIVEAYKREKKISKVCDIFHVSSRVVSMICRKAGIDFSEQKQYHHVHPEAYEEGSCYHCRAFSKISCSEGWCMYHRRTVKAKNHEACYK